MNSQVPAAAFGAAESLTLAGAQPTADRPSSPPAQPLPQAFSIGALLQHLPQSLPATRASFAIPVAILLLMLAWAVVPGLIAPYSPMDMDAQALLSAPSASHLLGTDHLGRDIYSLIVHGARQSIFVAVSAVAVGLVTGSAVGIVTGYVGRWVDAAFMRLLEIWLAVPDILLIIAIATALSPSITNIILTIGIVSAPRYARVMRAQVISIKHRPFVDAARAIGASDASILFRHILPHGLSPMLVLATLGVANALQTGAMLSFIGLGLISDIPDWGAVLNQARSYLTVAWWFGAFPGLAITILVIAINLIGDVMRQKLDPRGRAR
ncbi:ABC transporter permease [soil metagenome]